MLYLNVEEKNRTVGGMLYLVATPIGNLSDISERAVKVLSEVDFIAAEDTRNTLRLLTRLGISKAVVSYHEHNKRESGEKIAARLASGESCALVTDAGVPAISDPGEELVVLCAARNIPVTSIPGACAFVTALTLSALPTRRFVFEGFLPAKPKERRERLEVLAAERRTFVLHEAPHRLRATLGELCEYMSGDRRIAICRELTKLNEEVMRTTLSEAAEYYSSHEPRGEYVLVLDGAGEGILCANNNADGMKPEEAIAYYEGQGMTRTQAIKAAAQLLGISRNELYRLTIKS